MWTVNIMLVELKTFVQRMRNIEACVVTVNNEDFGVVVGIYRPAGNVEYFADLLSRILNDDRVINRNVILIGDMNVNLLDPVVSTDQYVSLLQSLSFLTYISRPTRFPPGDSEAVPSLLDHNYMVQQAE